MREDSPVLKVAEEIHAAIDLYKEKLSNHHLWLNEPIIRHTIMTFYETIIQTLEWVLDYSQSSPEKARNEK